MTDLRETIAALAPGADPEEMLNREVFLVQMVEPEVGLLVTAAGERERQIILHCTGIKLPQVERTEIDIAMPTYFAGRVGHVLMAYLLEELEPPPVEPTPAPVPRKLLSPYM